MHIASLIVALAALTAFAAATRPSIEKSDAVLTGKVLSVEKVKVQSDKYTKWELWRAKVRVQGIAKQDTNLTETLFLYYEQDHHDENGGHYMRGCPGRPRISTEDVRQFHCVRADVGLHAKVLFVPEAGWVTAPSEFKPATGAKLDGTRIALP